MNDFYSAWFFNIYIYIKDKQKQRKNKIKLFLDTQGPCMQKRHGFRRGVEIIRIGIKEKIRQTEKRTADGTLQT